MLTISYYLVPKTKNKSTEYSLTNLLLNFLHGIYDYIEKPYPKYSFII